MNSESTKDSDFEQPNSNSSMSSITSSDSHTSSCFDLTIQPPELVSKPHRSSDTAYSAIISATLRRKSSLNLADFNLLRRIGAGDIGKVYLCQLKGDDRCFYAMKVVDKEVLKAKRKIHRAEMEKRILKILDHPFLPSLYAMFEDARYSCVVMEFCSGGDLHSLRHKMPHKRFSLSTARFYAAEVLVALEYLHMLGIIYRDLKPENVLVRSDGHIMLSDFDLSLYSDSITAVESPPNLSSPPSVSTRKPGPFSCFPDRVSRSRKIQTMDRVFVAEPVSARSYSFVGTHEYVAPEIASGRVHGNAVDWWAMGIFIYEMIYGRTPFSGATNEATLRNIVKKPLTFPTDAPGSSSEMHARELISGLLVKDPESRLGSRRGSAEVKTHAFFKGLNFALIRSTTPPQIPGVANKSVDFNYMGRTQKESTAFDCF